MQAAPDPASSAVEEAAVEAAVEQSIVRARQAAVRKAFEGTWAAYELGASHCATQHCTARHSTAQHGNPLCSPGREGSCVGRLEVELSTGAVSVGRSRCGADAFGYDDLKPLSRKGEDWLGMGVAIVDSLDTMLLMGMGRSAAYARARAWIEKKFVPERWTKDISVFETTIR